jgi:glycosyltransferase involved in cell wall biosynthesis
VTELKILVFNWRCWLNPTMGGAEVFTREIAKRWVEAGHEVTLFTSEFPDCKREEIADGVRIIRNGGKYSVYARAKEHYRNHFSKEGYEVIIDEVNTRPFSTPKFVNKGEKIVALIHQLAREYWFYETPFPINYLGYHWLEKRWLKPYMRIPTVTVSESSRKDLIDLGFERVSVVGEGLNFTPLEKLYDNKNSVVIYTGRLTKAKRPDDAVKAFEVVSEKVPDAQLWVVGEGYLKNKLMQIAGSRVRFIGALSNGERRELVKQAKVLVNPSVREGFGLNIVEANALGVPCVTYDVAGLRDSVKDGETGLLVESGNVEALAEAIIRVLEDDALREKLSERALVYSRTFNWNDVADKFMGIIKAER